MGGWSIVSVLFSLADADSVAQVGSERRADRWLRAHEGTRPAEP